MTTIKILSDLHIEFHRDQGRSFIKSNENNNVDILILAGDIGSGNDLTEIILPQFCRKFKDVVYVTGNHEYYGSSPDKINQNIRAFEKECLNFHWIEKKKINISGLNIIGASLWFPDQPLNVLYEKKLNDFSLIKNFKPWVYQENKRSVDFLKKNIKQSDIVVTHHLPSSKSIPNVFAGSGLNRFFVCDMTDIIIKYQPTLWVHGHTHNSCDYYIDKTRVVCNSFGYPHELNDEYNEDLIVKL